MNHRRPRLQTSKGLLGLLLVLAVTAATVGYAAESDVIELGGVSKPKLQTSPSKTFVHPRFQSPVDSTTQLSPVDERNLSTLWNRVIQRNPVIQYGLKQLATPPELRYAQQSLMSRAVGGLLSGAAMLPLAMGADMFSSGATAMSANMVDRAMVNSQKIDPALLPSDTELVQLSSLVQSLQKSLVASYFEYKNSLDDSHQLELTEANLEDRLNRATIQDSPAEAFWTKEMLTLTAHQYLLSMQTARRQYLLLERLVGVEGMRDLRFDEQALKTSDKDASSQPHAAPNDSPVSQASSEPVVVYESPLPASSANMEPSIVEMGVSEVPSEGMMPVTELMPLEDSTP